MPKFNLEQLKTRTFSALVLAPVVLLIVYLGGYVYYAMVAACAVIAFYEWLRLAKKTDCALILSIAGFLYISLAGVVMAFLRDWGWEPLFLLFVLIWVSDVSAYFSGKIVGGPKMLPTVSPNKTWAGFAGACLGPMVILFVLHLFVGRMVGSYDVLYVLVGGFLIGISGQLGDLMVSKLKRIAYVKDSSDIIPGHGGLLDRIDSLLLTSIVVGLTFFVLSAYVFTH